MIRLLQEITGAQTSLRVWLVGGSNEPEIWTALGKFFDDYLEIPAHELNMEDNESVKRVFAREQQGWKLLFSSAAPQFEIMSNTRDASLLDM